MDDYFCLILVGFGYLMDFLLVGLMLYGGYYDVYYGGGFMSLFVGCDCGLGV